MIKLIHGDCLDKMNDIPDGSIDAIITDPPYGIMKGADLDGWKGEKTKWDNQIDQEKMFNECNRVLRTNGALILFSQDPYTSKLITETHNNLPFSYRYAWLKDHFANSLIAKKAPVSYMEDICVFFKKYDTLAQHPLRLYAKDIMRYIGKGLKEINTDLGHRKAEHFFYIESTQFGICTEATYNELIDLYQIDQMDNFMSYSDIIIFNDKFKFNRVFNLPNGKKYKSNVLQYKKDYSGLHPTQKPVALIKDLIKTYTNKGDTVLDFAMGSGTTGVACKNLNRSFIGIELDDKYFDIAKERINETV